RVAINLKDSINTDNDDIIADEEIIIEGASNAYFTKFPVKKIASKLKEIGYPVKITNSAGTFVCNSLYFNILHYIET
ncbi:MAG: pyroglutamyl-peptidase I, partial [Muribaculaceae bacterium]|nr:pyroglutamyl-peptidase I [Muribaculaceae bacterium]